LLRKIFGSRRDEVAGYWRRWHTEDIRDPDCLPILFWLIISRRTGCVGMWQARGRGIYWFVVGKLEGTNNLKVLDTDEIIILNGSAKE
jgi:hypothetical protein